MGVKRTIPPSEQQSAELIGRLAEGVRNTYSAGVQAKAARYFPLSTLVWNETDFSATVSGGEHGNTHHIDANGFCDCRQSASAPACYHTLMLAVAMQAHKEGITVVAEETEAEILPTQRGFTAEQYDQLLQPIGRNRVMQANGHSHVTQQDVRAHLSRLFGFDGWDTEIIELRCIQDAVARNKSGKEVPAVTYLCRMRLTIRDLYGNIVKVCEDAATGSSPNLPSYGDAHDFSAKNAISYALKRCAVNLGDQFGLSLYNKGQTNALVIKSLAHPNLRNKTSKGDIQQGVPEQVDMGDEGTSYTGFTQEQPAQPDGPPWYIFTRLLADSGVPVRLADDSDWDMEKVDRKLAALLNAAYDPSIVPNADDYRNAIAAFKKAKP